MEARAYAAQAHGRGEPREGGAAAQGAQAGRGVAPGSRGGVSCAALTCKGRFATLGSQQFVGRRATALKGRQRRERDFPAPVSRCPILSASPLRGRPARPLTSSNPLCGSGGRVSLRPCCACVLGSPDAARPDQDWRADWRGSVSERSGGPRGVGPDQRRPWAPEGARRWRGAASGAEALRGGGEAAGWMGS